MDQITSAIKSALKPVQSLYNRAFNANKYAAGIGLSVRQYRRVARPYFVVRSLRTRGDSA